MDPHYFHSSSYAKTPSKKSAKAPKKAGKGSKKKTRVQSYATYIYKVLKQVHPKTGTSKRSVSVLNSFIGDIFDRIATEASKLARYTKKKTLSSREVQTAVRLTLPGELAKHSVSEGTKAVTKYKSSSYYPSSSTSYFKGQGKGGKAAQNAKPTSRSSKAGLQFPVGRIHRYMKARHTGRVGSTAAVYMAAVLEYLTAEILELAGNACNDLKFKRITPRHLQLAIRGDLELDKLLAGITIASGGTLPNIHSVLLIKGSKAYKVAKEAAKKKAGKAYAPSEEAGSYAKSRSRTPVRRRSTTPKRPTTPARRRPKTPKKTPKKHKSTPKKKTPKRSSHHRSPYAFMGIENDHESMENESFASDLASYYDL